MRNLLSLAVLVAFVACSNGGEGAAPAPSPSASFPIATVLLDNGEESTLVTVEVAETPEQRERGLSEVESLRDDEGRVFVFFEEQDEGLSARGASIPLSVAFFDAEGTIVGIAEMEPCVTVPCADHAPDEPYMGALAVKRGMFEEWDIVEGDHVQLTR